VTGFLRISAGATLLIALGVTLGMPAELAAEPFRESTEMLSIGLPSNENDARQSPVDLTDPRDRGVVLEYNLGQFSLRGGKINPSVGISWERPRQATAPAGVERDLETPGRVGVSTSMEFDPDRLGNHRLTGEASFLDLSSFQSGGARDHGFYDSRSSDRWAGGTGSAGFSLMLEGGRFAMAPDLSYRLGYIQRPGGHDPSMGEAGFTAGIANRFDFSSGITLTPSIEAARMSGGASAERDFFAASMMTEWRNWNMTLTYGRRDGDGSAVSLIDSYEAGASIGYVFDSGVTADIGWERQKQADEIADHIGFQFKYRFGFGR
jgi:hypothetical protein